MKLNFRDDAEGLVVILGNSLKMSKFIIIFQVIMCFTHSPESKKYIGFNEQICFYRFFMNMVTLLHVCAFDLFTNCLKKVSRESF